METTKTIEPVSTTFRMDFDIAERFGIDAVKDTYRRSLNGWKHDIRYMADLVMTLNHKIWQHYQTNEKLAKVYNDMWAEAEDLVYTMADNSEFSKEEISFFFNYLD